MKHWLKIVFATALLGTLWSLYHGLYGDPVANIVSHQLFNPAHAMPPCLLCWYARILLYPVVCISLVGILKKSRDTIDYIIPFAVIGFILEIYQFWLQKFPNIFSSGLCDRNNPCNAIQVQYFWFVTIPFLWLLAFAIILIVAILIKRSPRMNGN